jgi:hypothetical protein
MEDTSLFKFVVRGLLQISACIVRQLPSSMGVRIDQAKFTSAFTMKHDSKSITAEPWPEAPDGSVSDPLLPGEVDVDEMDPSVKAAYNRKKIHMDWIDHKTNIAKFIPCQWGYVKDDTDITNRNTKVDKPKREPFYHDHCFILTPCHRCRWGLQQEKQE